MSSDSVTDPDGTVPTVFHENACRTDGHARPHVAMSIRPGGYLDEVELVANLGQPLALLHGAQEKVVRLDYLRKLALPTLWRGVVQVIAGAGHAPQRERAGEFDALVAAFVKECAG